jgi:hypothetical protein
MGPPVLHQLSLCRRVAIPWSTPIQSLNGDTPPVLCSGKLYNPSFSPFSLSAHSSGDQADASMMQITVRMVIVCHLFTAGTGTPPGSVYFCYLCTLLSFHNMERHRFSIPTTAKVPPRGFASLWKSGIQIHLAWCHSCG